MLIRQFDPRSGIVQHLILVLFMLLPHLLYGMEPEKPAQGSSQAVPKDQVATKDQEASENASFDLLELRVKGNTLLKGTLVERVVYPFLGPKKTIDTVVSAQKALESLYHDKGYQTVLVDIPEQDVENGIVYLDVIEGKVSRLRVKGSRYFSLNKIKAGVPELAVGKVPNMTVMQEQIDKLGIQSEDRRIAPVLRAGDTPGTLEVDLNVKDELPLHGRLELNGRNTAATSRLRLVSSLHYDNLWQKMHSASLMFQVSPEESQEVQVWAGTYALPVPALDSKLALYAVSSSSTAQIAQVGNSNVIGIGEIYGIRLIKPLPGLGDYSHNFTVGADYKDFKENLNFVDLGKEIKTPIHYLPFMAQYDASLIDKNFRAAFNLGVHFAIRGLAASSPKDFDEKHFKSRSNYAYLTAETQVNYDLPWGVELASRITGQLADSPLIPNEQFSLGGMQSIRGYFETQALADDGFTASMEFRSPRLVPIKLDYINKLQGLVFVDGGMGWSKKTQGPQKHVALASVGFGLRLQMWKYLSGVLDVGFPLLGINTINSGDPKVHFSIATEF